MSNHHEPWRRGWEHETRAEIEDATGKVIAAARSGVLCGEGVKASGIARRIVAAVNSVAGIPTEALEAGKLGEALGMLFDALVETDPDDVTHESGGCDGSVPECPSCRAVALLRVLGRLP